MNFEISLNQEYLISIDAEEKVKSVSNLIFEKGLLCSNKFYIPSFSLELGKKYDLKLQVSSLMNILDGISDKNQDLDIHF